MKININQEQIKGIGKFGLKVGKNILVEGSKAILLNMAATTIKTAYDEGLGGLKDIDYMKIADGSYESGKKKKKVLFKKSEDVEVVEVEVVEPEVTE